MPDCPPQPPPARSLTRFLSEPSGSDRPQWAWSCWQRPGTTPLCRGCSRRLISTTQACWAAWTAPQRRRRPRPCTAACTGLLRHPTRSCSGRWCPASSSTAWGLGDSRPSTLCPTPSQAPRIPGEEGGTVPKPSSSHSAPDSCPASPRTRPTGIEADESKGSSPVGWGPQGPASSQLSICPLRGRDAKLPTV